jgi:hypothetical protein
LEADVTKLDKWLLATAGLIILIEAALLIYVFN